MNNNQFRSLKRVLCALTAVIMVFAAAGDLFLQRIHNLKI